ncbi:MAG: hypothetical protein KGJ82_03610 [Nitrospirota bacterium]|nr:hypothetical protein [Nitrospirota bacterium]
MADSIRPGRHLTEAHRELIRLLAACAVAEYVREHDEAEDHIHAERGPVPPDIRLNEAPTRTRGAA